MVTKKSKKLIIIALIFIAFVALSGCAGKKATTQVQQAAAGKVFVGGSDGVAVSFLPGSPPKDTFTNTPFDISVLLQNKGEHSLTKSDVRIYFSGISPQAFGVLTADFEKKYEKPLQKAQLVGGQAIPGEQDQITVTTQGYRDPNNLLPGPLKFSVAATTCYPYQTQAIALACLSQNLLAQTVGQEICKISGEKNPQSSGAPVKVISAIELPLGKNKVGFQIKIKDSGIGNTYTLPAGEADCRKATQASLGRATVSAKVGTIALSCSPTTVILAENKEGLTTCSAEITGVAGMQQELLTISLAYNYMQQKSQEFIVRPLGA